MTARTHTFVSVTVCFLMIALAATAQKGRIVTEKIHCPSLEGNVLGDSPERSVIVYLPPSYDAEPDRHYPVVYLIHRYTGNGQHVWLNGETGDFPSIMNVWVEYEKVKEMIIVPSIKFMYPKWSKQLCSHSGSVQDEVLTRKEKASCWQEAESALAIGFYSFLYWVSFWQLP